jgi:glycosyltransferase involved in cell wall biosynthesis
MKTLGICIPVYRRPDMLKRCILSAIASAGSCPITVFIADDSVSDANVAVITELQAEHPFVRWQRNEVNHGIDRNIQVALAMSDCDHAWLIGEDDLFLPDAVTCMHALIQTRDDPFIFSNYLYVTEDHRRVLGAALPDVVDGEQSTEKFIMESLWSTGFIGACVLRCADLQATSGAHYDGTYFTHVGRILDLLANHPTVYVSSRPAIANRSQGADTFTWKKDSFGVFLGFERMCSAATQKNPALSAALVEATRNYRRRFAYFSVKSTFRLRSQGAFDLRQFRTHVAGCRIEPWRKAWMLLLALTPRAMLIPFASAYVAHVERQRRRREAAGSN